MHLIYLFQSVFMSNSYIIVHETAVYWNRVSSLMRILWKNLRLSHYRDVCFSCLFYWHNCNIYSTADRREHSCLCALCIEWQSFVVRHSVADGSTLRGWILESKRSKMVHCNSKHIQSLLGMRIYWNFHQPTYCRRTSWSFIMAILVSWEIWKYGHSSIYNSTKTITWAIIKPCIHNHTCMFYFTYLLSALPNYL